MRTVALTPASAALVDGIVCHDVRNPAQRNEIFARKGAHLTADEIRGLFDRGVADLHVAVPDADDVGEDAAALRLARALGGADVGCDPPHFGQVSFRAAARGMFRVARPVLDRVNQFADVLLLTAEADRPVEPGMTLGVVKCAPLFLGEPTLQAIEGLGTPVFRVDAFRSLRVGFVAPLERLRGGAFDRSRDALSNALEWYGSSLEPAIGAEATVPSLTAAYQELRGADLILAAGAAGTDPLDVVFEGLRQAGGEVTQIGIPLEPGTACWIGRLGTVPVLGLASCELFGQPGALDLLLPALHVGEELDAALLRQLALGGLLIGPSRIAPYHARPAATD